LHQCLYVLILLNVPGCMVELINQGSMEEPGTNSN